MTATASVTVISESVVSSTSAPRLELDHWRERGFRAGITCREGDFDLGVFAGGRAGTVMANLLAFHASQQPDFPAIAFAQQVHGAQLSWHDEIGSGWLVSHGIDGHLTARPGLLLVVMVADCIPVYLAHRESATLALLHAGWKGVAAGILEAGLKALESRCGCRRADIAMHCGVGICGDCYEVGPEVIERVTGRPASRRGTIDLRAILADRAAQAGLRDVTVSSWCSSHHPKSFFSHRRSGGEEGRMFAYLGASGAVR